MTTARWMTTVTSFSLSLCSISFFLSFFLFLSLSLLLFLSLFSLLSFFCSFLSFFLAFFLPGLGFQTPLRPFCYTHLDGARSLLRCVLEIERRAELKKKIQCDIFAFLGRGDTPLMIACRSSNHHAIKPLLAVGADPNIFNNLGYVPLHYACHTGNEKTVQALLESYEVEVNLQAKGSDSTALHFAQQVGHPVLRCSPRLPPRSRPTATPEPSDHHPLPCVGVARPRNTAALGVAAGRDSERRKRFSS